MLNLRATPQPASDAELLDQLQLIRSENVGPVTFRRLLERYGSAAAALKALPALAQKGGARSIKIATRDMAEAELAACRKNNVEILVWGSAVYGQRLAAIDDAPPLLFVRGHAHLLSKPSVGIVGARNASLNARKFTEKLARDLTDAGYVVTSGLARGIDAAAHTGALKGGTVGVLAGGVDHIYPEENTALYHQMAEAGAIVSEMPLGYHAMQHDFLRRNRIISGLSLGVVVVEAALRSGSLTTASRAADQGREVMAVPGSPLDPRSTGTNNLLREGAVLVEGAADVIRALGTANAHLAEPDNYSKNNKLNPPLVEPAEADLDRGRPVLEELLSPVPVGVDDLIRESGLPVGVVLTIVLELELAGRLTRSSGGRVALIA